MTTFDLTICDTANAARRRRGRRGRHRPADAGERRRHRRRVHRRAAMGRAVAQPRQRRGGAARTDRRLAHHRSRGSRRTRPPAGGTAWPARARRSTPTAGARSPPTCSAAAAGRRARVRSPRTESRGAHGSRRSPCATRSRPTSPRWPRWASPRSPRSSAAPWAARARWSGSSAIPTRCAPPWCWRSAHAPPPIRSARRAPRSRRSSPTRTGRAATTTAPGARRDIGMEIARRFAHLTYRGEAELDDRFGNDAQGDEDPATGGRYAVQSYLEYQGRKLVARFDAGTYVGADRRADQPRRRPRPRRRGRPRCAAARCRWSSAASPPTGCTRCGCRRNWPNCCRAVRG